MTLDLHGQMLVVKPPRALCPPGTHIVDLRGVTWSVIIQANEVCSPLGVHGLGWGGCLQVQLAGIGCGWGPCLLPILLKPYWLLLCLLLVALCGNPL